MIQATKISISPDEIKILVEVLEGLVSYILSKSDISDEDKTRLIAVQDRLNVLLSKERRIANED